LSLVPRGLQRAASAPEEDTAAPGSAYVPTTFSLPAVLPRLSNRRFNTEANLPNATNNRLTARLVRNPGGELITDQDISMTRTPLGDYFGGVLGRDPSTYDFL